MNLDLSLIERENLERFHCTICGASRVELGDDDACSPDAD